MSRHEHVRGHWRDLSGGEASLVEGAKAPASTARALPMINAQLDSRDLFAAARVITIAHGDQVYQLRLTAQNKLILTK
ncbi:hemin uptake protein HemP [Xanthobacter pseudotagetidis]|uniref:hemin uptake protein HemP n=1 Tax=Xanthobacter pseudotagetidis TaxID=3119911 RepID=UPI00372647C4